MPLFKYECKNCKLVKEKIFSKPEPSIACVECGAEMMRVWKGGPKVYQEKHEIPSHRTEIVEDVN